MQLPYVEVDGVLVDELVHMKLEQEGYQLVPPSRAEDEYPCIRKPGDEHGEPLHLYVVRLHQHWMTAEYLEREGLVVHHRNHRKSDARLENLQFLPRASHTTHHNRTRQVFTLNKKQHLFGFFSPDAAKPQPVSIFTKKEREALEEQLKTAEARPPLLRREEDAKKKWREEDQEVEARLAALLPALRLEDEERQEGAAPIPPPSSRHHQRDRLLGLQPVRRGCTPGEAAFVRVFIEFMDLKTMAEALKLPEPALRRIFRRSAVNLALENWRHHRRLPPPSSYKKLRVYLGHEGLGHLARPRPAP